MHQKWATINDRKELEEMAQSVGGKFIELYALTESLLQNREGQALSEGFYIVRIRENSKPPQCKATLQSALSGADGRLELGKEEGFDSEQEALEAFTLRQGHTPIEYCRFRRTGMCYELPERNIRVFIEDVEGVGAMLELEGDSEAEIEAMMKKFRVQKVIEGVLGEYVLAQRRRSTNLIS